MASAIHCGFLPSDRVPSFEEILALVHYDDTTPENVGVPYLMGEDEFGNPVYFMGLLNQRDKLLSCILQVLMVAGINKNSYIFQDTFPLITFSTKIGGILSKRYAIIHAGRWLTVWGIRRRYWDFVFLVNAIKARLE